MGTKEMAKMLLQDPHKVASAIKAATGQSRHLEVAQKAKMALLQDPNEVASCIKEAITGISLHTVAQKAKRALLRDPNKLASSIKEAISKANKEKATMLLQDSSAIQ